MLRGVCLLKEFRRRIEGSLARSIEEETVLALRQAILLTLLLACCVQIYWNEIRNQALSCKYRQEQSWLLSASY